MTVPTASLAAHQAQLKQALLAASPPTKTTTKHIWRILMRKKKIVIPGVASAVVALALAVGIVIQMQMPVSAAELTRRSIHTVATLSPSERKDLNTRVNGDAQKVLEDAKKAKDLKVLTYDEYKKQATQVPGAPNGSASLPIGDRAGGPDITKLRYLVYTGNDGTHNVIGIDDNNLPVLIMTYRSGPDGGQQGSAMIIDDKGQPGTSTAGNGTTPVGGSTQCTQQAGSETPVCTTTGDAPAPTCTHELDGSTKCSTASPDNSSR